MTLPEAYEFFFCDTIEEEDKDAVEAAEADQALAGVQWPDTCEFFFQDRQAQRSGHWGGHTVARPPQAEPVAASPPGDPLPNTKPPADEHIHGEDVSGGVLELAALLQLQATEPPGSVPWGVGSGTSPEPSPVTAEQLSLAVRQAGECRLGPGAVQVPGTYCPESSAKQVSVAWAPGLSRSRERTVQRAQPGGLQGRGRLGPRVMSP